MTTQRRSAVAVSGLAIVTLVLFVGGCGAIVESNQAACERGVNRVFDCVSFLTNLPFPDDVSVSEACEGVPETVECREWSTFANCVISASCTDPQSPEECFHILERLADNECGSGAPEGLDSSDPTPGTPACQHLTGFELCLLDGSCLPDCPD